MLWYAYGPAQIKEGIPSSAFSKGDILMYTSASSLSRIPISTASVGALPNSTVCGVAMSDSNFSYNNKVPYVVADRDTVFWSDATTTSQFTAGESLDVEFTGNTFRVTTSVISKMVRIVPPGDSVDINAIYSGKSVTLVRFAELQLLYRL